MKKRILLVEPAYRTKYPPLGLMKLSTYHKQKGDEVVFVKGKIKKAINQFWDRIYISTLFTWTWDETVKTIMFYYGDNPFFPPSSKCYVGGILATLMPRELSNATGVTPIMGLLDNPKKIDQDDSIIIDALPPDYDILEQVNTEDFQYSNADAYLGYTTRGCVRKCGFCAVRTLEPKYNSYIDIKTIIKVIQAKYGDKKNLLLMDNNVLCSKDFDKIINDIKACGFYKGATYGPTKIKRTVDFNQGLDAAFLSEHKMIRLAEIPLDPMRIAFDSIEDTDIYMKAVRLAHKHGQLNMSNYVLYNYQNDTPEDFYERLKINIDLNKEFQNDGSGVKTVIYSFPMRYIPLYAKKRDIETGNSNWNKLYLRSVKAILNVTKGPVMPGSEFFEQAFGVNGNEFKAILSMPDIFITNRLIPNWKKQSDHKKRWTPYVREWMETYGDLTPKEHSILIEILGNNDLEYAKNRISDCSKGRVSKLVKYHLNAEEIVSRYKNEK